MENYKEQLIKTQAEEVKAITQYKNLVATDTFTNSNKFWQEVGKPIQANRKILEQLVSLEAELNDCN